MSVVVENNLDFISGLEPTNITIGGDAVNAAKNTLESTPLPTTRVEAWKYTRVAKIGKINFKNNVSDLNEIGNLKVIDSPFTYVFVNGRFNASLSSKETPEGMSIQTLSESNSLDSNMKVEGDIFSALNLAYLHDGVEIIIENKAVINTPVQVLHILKGEAQLSNFKLKVKSGNFSKATVVEGFFSDDASQCFANCTSEIEVGVNAHLTIEKLQSEQEGNFHIGTDQVVQDKDSTFTINTITLDGSLVRNNLNIDVNGENCTTNLNGGYILKGKQHVDNHTIVDHKVPNCNSNELYKGVIDDKGTAVFNGKVFVRQDAQKINAFQSNRNVLLSDDASMNSKPELEIYADDVKCSHGSTTGQLDEESIYYLRARGLSKKSAIQLLVSAFVAEVIELIKNEDVKSFVFGKLKERFGWDVNPEDFG